MPKIDQKEYQTAKASGGDYERMPAGGYICAIQAVRASGVDGYGRMVDYVNDKQYVKLIWDIIEGDFAGKYSDDYWSEPERDYGHQFFMSWKNLGALKNTITCLEESNPGFDAMAALEADQWGLFVGKQMGLVIGEEEYRANDGSIKRRYTLPRIKSVQDIRDGKFRVPALKKLEEGGEVVSKTDNGGGADTNPYDSDVPF